MWKSSPSQSQKNAKLYYAKDKLIKNHPGIEREAPTPRITCIKHPGRELEFLRKRDGILVWAICILQESEQGEKDIKDRYWVKHPGFEKLFFCKTCAKGIWEKCIKIHSDHDIVTIVLESQKLLKDLNRFKSEFDKLMKDWEELFQKFNTKKEHIEFEVDKTSKAIENYFDELIK